MSTRTALVTGGTRGIGHAIARELKAQGCRVAAVYHGNDAAADAFRNETSIATFKWDVADFAACEKGIAAVESALGPIEILVNNAGIVRDVPLHDGSRLRIRKLDRDYDPSDRLCALYALEEAEKKNEVLTGVSLAVHRREVARPVDHDARMPTSALVRDQHLDPRRVNAVESAQHPGGPVRDERAVTGPQHASHRSLPGHVRARPRSGRRSGGRAATSPQSHGSGSHSA